MITPMDIHNKTFSGQIRGYSKDEVNAFLEELASDYEKIYREHRAMEEEMDIIRTKLRNYEKMESTMSHTLVMAQETADNVKKNAHKEAALSIQEALSEAQKIVSDAEAARRKMNADLLKAEGMGMGGAGAMRPMLAARPRRHDGCSRRRRRRQRAHSHQTADTSA